MTCTSTVPPGVTAMRLSAREVAGRSRTARDPLRRSFSPG